MFERDLSTDVEFITTPEREPGKRFGSHGAIPNLAVDPESTGAAILSKSLVDRKVASRGDLRRAPSRERPPAEMIRGEQSPTWRAPAVARGRKCSWSGSPSGRRGAAGDREGHCQGGNRPGAGSGRGVRGADRRLRLPPGWFLDTGLARARAVCKIETSGIDFWGRQGGWSGTGFLISDNLVMDESPRAQLPGRVRERRLHLNACGKRESNEFEPMEEKGAVARATLYFLLRYPGKIVRENARVLAQRLPTLLSWHLAEPVSQHERHRNAAIQELQGNRNPLVDFPKLGARIDFTRGLGA